MSNQNRRSLPVVREAVAELPAPVPAVPPPLFVSKNSKTGFSVNVAITLSCRPTEACSRYCYGKAGPIAMRAAVNRQEQNFHRLRWLAEAPPSVVATEADMVYWHVKPYANFLRFFGVGDLQPGSVKLIKTLAKRHPDLALWVATRKFDLALDLPFVRNVHVMLGLDSTTKGADLHAAYELVRERAPQFYGSWVQREADEVIPAWVQVVFAVHRGSNRAKWSAEAEDVRLCEATRAGEKGAEHEGACGTCRRCFDVSVREARRQK